MDIFGLIQKNKNAAVSIGIILLAIFVSLRIYQAQEKEIANLKKRAQNEAKSNEIFKNLVGLEDKINAYKRSLKIKNTGEVMSVVSNITKDAGIKLDSIRPLGDTMAEDYIRFSVSAIMRFRNYNQLGEFMSKLENDSALLSIDSFRISRDDQNLVLNAKISAIRAL